MGDYLKIRMNSDDDQLPERPKDSQVPHSDDRQEETKPTETSPETEHESMFPLPHPMFPDASQPVPPPVSPAVSDPQVRLRVAERAPLDSESAESAEEVTGEGEPEKETKDRPTYRRFIVALGVLLIAVLVLAGLLPEGGKEKAVDQQSVEVSDRGPAALKASAAPGEGEASGKASATEIKPDSQTEAVRVAGSEEETPETEHVLPENLNLVEDPQGFYAVQLRPGFKVVDQSQPNRSKRTYAYNENLSVTVIASKTKREWDAEKELARKLAAISDGRSPLPPNVSVAKSQPLDIAKSSGYEIGFTGTHGGKDTRMHAFATVKEGTSISISIVCGDPKQFGEYESIIAGIKDTLKLRSAEKVSTKPASRKAAPARRPWEPTEEDWRQAEAAVDFAGVMKRGDALVALVGRSVVRQGETITVQYKGHGYTFLVEDIDDYELKLKPVHDESADVEDQ